MRAQAIRRGEPDSNRCCNRLYRLCRYKYSGSSSWAAKVVAGAWFPCRRGSGVRGRRGSSARERFQQPVFLPLIRADPPGGVCRGEVPLLSNAIGGPRLPSRRRTLRDYTASQKQPRSLGRVAPPLRLPVLIREVVPYAGASKPPTLRTLRLSRVRSPTQQQFVDRVGNNEQVIATATKAKSQLHLKTAKSDTCGSSYDSKRLWDSKGNGRTSNFHEDSSIQQLRPTNNPKQESPVSGKRYPSPSNQRAAGVKSCRR